MEEKTSNTLPHDTAGMQNKACCPGAGPSSIQERAAGSSTLAPETVRGIVRDGYAKVALTGAPCCGPAGCCTDTSRHMGYTDAEMNAVPEGANLGLGCGNPTAIAALKPGETVVDLGSGGGFDCFLAAAKVGETGRVIGVDMTAEMIDLARANAKKGRYANVEFRLGEIENLPVADCTADVVISNCVINLSPDKDRVFREAFRVLKPGGRVMVSDIVLLKDLPEEIRASVAAYVGCVAGAVSRDTYLNAIRDAGFSGIRVLSETPMPFELMAADPTVQSIAQDLALSREAGMQLAESILSITVHAEKGNPGR
jgi:SAM-dependent methyltransferase